MRPLHVGIVTSAYPPQVDGFATYGRDLAEGLAQLGQQVTVVVAGSDPPAATDEHLVEVVHLGGSLSVLARGVASITGIPQLARSMHVRRALRDIHHYRPFDVIEFMNWGVLGLAHSLRKVAPQAIRVTTGIGQLELPPRRLERVRARLLERVEALTVRRSDLVITPARGHWDAIAPRYRTVNREPVVVPFGIDLRDAAPVPVEPAPWPCRLLYVGRLSHRKGFDVLMAALPAVLRDAQGDVSLTVIGRDPGDVWRTIAVDLDADVLSRVDYRGEVPDSSRDAAYAECDIFVAPSRYESFGLMYIEAMARCMPVVGCRVGGTPEVVDEGKVGLLVAPGDSDALAAALLSLVNDPPLRRRIGRAALAATRERFDRARMAERTLEAYWQTIADRGCV